MDIDKLLSRLSNLSQIGLLLAAVFTIWYTVIPLYGKAVLEEQVAEKQIELNKLTEKINHQYSTMISNYKYQLRVQFTTLCFITAPEYLNADRKGRIYYNPNKCIKSTISNILNNSALTENDKFIIQNKVDKMILNIDKENKKLVAEYEAMNILNYKDIEKLPELSGQTKHEYEAYKNLYIRKGRPFPKEEELIARKVQLERDLISSKTKIIGDIILKTL